MQRGVAQHVARYGGNVGTETWPFWLDVQVFLCLILMVLRNLRQLQTGVSEAARADCTFLLAVHMHVVGYCAVVVYCCSQTACELLAWSVHECMHMCICVSVAAASQPCLDMLAWMCHIFCGARALLCSAPPCLPCPTLPALPLSYETTGRSSMDVLLLRYSYAFALCLQCEETVTVSIAASFLTKTAAIESFTQQMPDWTAHSATTTFQSSWTF